MLLFDMPLDKLKQYKGINPCPNDFDEYWDESLKEMKNIEPNVELIPRDFQVPYAECFDMFFTGIDNAKIHVKYIKPKNINKKHPAVLQFHGYAGNCGQWYDKLCYAAMGISFFAMDCRGQGGLSQDVSITKGTTYKGQIIRGLGEDPKELLYRKIFLDATQLARIVMDMPDIDENRVGAMGISQGGGLTLACGALEPRIKKLAIAYPFLSDYKRVWEIELANKNAYEELTYYFRWFDPRHEKEDEIFKQLGYIDVQNLAHRIKGEVLMATGLSDEVCPPSTQFATYNKIKSKKNVLFYPDFGHEVLPEFSDITLQFMSKL